MNWFLHRILQVTIVALAFATPGMAEPTSRQTELATHLAETVLSTAAPGDISLLPTASAALTQTGISANRFSLERTDILRHDNVGDEQAITLLAVYREETERRLWLVIRAWYDTIGRSIVVSRAEPFWNSPDSPEVQLRIVPRGSITNTQESADTYAKNIALLGDIVGAAVDPSESVPEDFDLVLTFIDRIAFDAEITFAASATPNGTIQATLDGTRLDATGWPIVLIEGAQMSDGFLQVHYRPGSDKDPSKAESQIIAAYSIADLVGD